MIHLGNVCYSLFDTARREAKSVLPQEPALGIIHDRQTAYDCQTVYGLWPKLPKVSFG